MRFHPSGPTSVLPCTQRPVSPTRFVHVILVFPNLYLFFFLFFLAVVHSPLRPRCTCGLDVLVTDLPFGPRCIGRLDLDARRNLDASMTSFGGLGLNLVPFSSSFPPAACWPCPRSPSFPPFLGPPLPLFARICRRESPIRFCMLLRACPSGTPIRQHYRAPPSGSTVGQHYRAPHPGWRKLPILARAPHPGWRKLSIQLGTIIELPILAFPSGWRKLSWLPYEVP